MATEVNQGSFVLFRRGLLPGNKSYGDWEPGYIDQTYWVDADERCVDALAPGAVCWVTIVPAVPEGAAAPDTVPVPLTAEHIDPVLFGAASTGDAAA